MQWLVREGERKILNLSMNITGGASILLPLRRVEDSIPSAYKPSIMNRFRREDRILVRFSLPLVGERFSFQERAKSDHKVYTVMCVKVYSAGRPQVGKAINLLLGFCK